MKWLASYGLSLLLGGFLGPPSASAVGVLPSQQEFDHRIAENPVEAYEWAESLYLKMTTNTPENDRIRITNFLLMSAVQLERYSLTTGIIPNIRLMWQRAGEMAMIEERLSLGLTLSMMLYALDQTEEAEQLIRMNIREARQWRNDSFLMQSLTNHGQILSYRARTPEALKLFHEAQELANSKSSLIDPMQRYVTRITVVMSLDKEAYGSFDAIVRDALDYFQRNSLQSYVAIFSFNAAMNYRNREPPLLDQATHYFQIALESARQIQDVSTQGAVFAEMANIQNSRRDYAAALESARQAIVIIGSSDERWLGRSFYQRALAHFGLGSYEAAAQDVKRSLKLTPSDFVEQMAGIYDLKSQIEEKLGRWQESLESHKVLREFSRKAVVGREDANFAKARAELGLQLEEQKNTILQKQNELQALKIDANRRAVQAVWALSILLGLAVFLFIWALTNAKRIGHARAQIAHILDIIEEGILTINQNLSLEPFHSTHLQKLYPDLQSAQGDAVTKLFPESAVSTEQQSMIRESLRACLGEPMLAWDLNASQYPHEIVWNSQPPKIMSLHWQPILDGQQHIKGVLLSLRDVTEQKLLQDMVSQRLAQAEAEQKRIQELMLSDRGQVQKLLQNLELQLASHDEPQRRLERLHTSKGEARTLGLRKLSAAIHQAESNVSAAKSDDFQDLQAEMKAYAEVLQKFFPELKASAIGINSLLDIVGFLLPGVKQHLQSADHELGSIQVYDAVDQWPSSLLGAAQEVLLHALTNAADHGYILAQRKLAAEFSVTATLERGFLNLAVRDAGAGLNRQKLEQLARDKAYRPQGRETWADVVFLEGTTTAGETTSTSGRGVGLSRVRKLCHEFGGEAHMQANDWGEGTLLKMSFRMPESVPSGIGQSA